MKVLIYFQDEDTIQTSGIGRAMRHQMTACALSGVPFTINPKETFDIAHINTIWAKSKRLLRRLNRISNGICRSPNNLSKKERARLLPLNSDLHARNFPICCGVRLGEVCRFRC